MRGPLEGVVVLDLSRVLSGPQCCMIMGDLGAEVIKIEKPDEGDLIRGNSPQVSDQSTYFLAHNRSKKDITLDFRAEKAKEIFRELVKKADVIVENFRAGTMEAMGFGYDVLKEINPRIILTRISGFGQTGPYANRTCFDGAAQALSGLMDITGPEDGPPYMVGTYVVDYSTGLYAIIGTLCALREREATGVGQVVDVALLDTAVSLLHTAIPDYKLAGEKFSRNGNNDRYMWPGNFYKSSDDRYVYVHAGADHTFNGLMKIMGREDLLQDSRYNNREARKVRENRDYLDKVIGEWALTKTSDEIIAIATKNGSPCAVVNNVIQMMDDPQVNHRHMIAEVDHPTIGKVYLAGPVIHFSQSKAEVRSAPPLLGQHNKEIYGGLLGMTDAEIEQLQKDKVI